MRGSPGEASTDLDLHVPADQLLAYAAGSLAEAERAIIEAHLRTCSACKRIAGPRASTVEDTSPLPMPPTPFRARMLGTFHERYEIKRPLGSGGMGAVYEALDLHLHRLVALKLLRLAPEHPKDREEAAARLVREARAMAVLSHRNVVTVYDVGTHEDQVFVAMQLVDGHTLRGWLAGQSRSTLDILAVMRGAGTGLAAAHAAGLVHRDFKPDNVLISTNGTPRVTDFGLARRADLSDAPTLNSHDRVSAPRVIELDTTPTVTRSGAVVGTPAYMAPEQVSGDPCDARADQFSFCVTSWEALFGNRPFGGGTWSEIYSNVISGNVIEPPADFRVPRTVVKALRRGLSAKPSERFPSMTELLGALDVAIELPVRRRRWGQWIALFSLGAAAATAVVIFALRAASSDEPKAKPAAAPPAERPPLVVIGPTEPQPVKITAEAIEPVRPPVPTDPAPTRPSRPRPSVVEKPSVAVVTPAAVVQPAPPDTRVADLNATKKALAADVRSRGLLATDLPASYQAAIDDANTALESGELAQANEALGRARAAADSVVINGEFIDRKLQRFNDRITALPADRREELTVLLKEVLGAYKRNDFAGANAKLNVIAAKLGLR